mmetsp:Transcript_32656/g.32017  ORF Transcript_32656/g.32017 Transcript_32656/m.32017 type:complete len:104 (+) Transcript_32656:462-773(+)
MIFSMITGGSIFEILAGYAIGHLYEFLTQILPKEHGYDLLQTPTWFKRFVNWVDNFLFVHKQPAGQRQANNIRNLNRDDPGQEFNNANRFGAFRGRGVRIGGE